MIELDWCLFLKSVVLIGCLVVVYLLMLLMIFVLVLLDNWLVVIILCGVMDGLDVLQFYGDLMLVKLWCDILVGFEWGVLDLDGFYVLYFWLQLLLLLWQKGELGFVYVVLIFYCDKCSYFDGQDLLEVGIGNDLLVDCCIGGWLNWLLQIMLGVIVEIVYVVGVEQMCILLGDVVYLVWVLCVSLMLLL